ncbi:beta-lactamase family protein [Streptomyces sp. MBT49]|uniref:serine hydrolase domain-containing protein n=1 Tax=Streptomyces sp. MBT49 TaxID=1488380 RepID=UPI00190CAB58|nr:serine hydrolase domain-containing protein [Streptomyces sp. MBT49]MBK3624600.1 beta-lactamase family protein [Streptomyces sp. MBT49]
MAAVALTAALVGPLATTPSTAYAVDGGTAVRQDGTAETRAHLRSLARQLVEEGVPGVIVRVDDGHGRPIEIAEQAAWTRKDHRLRADDEVREASNTKTVMATLVLQLVAEHRLALTDPVDKWLPGQVRDGRAITLRMLLNHTSGLFDYTEDPALVPALTGWDPHVWTSTEILSLVRGHPALFEPGAEWSYSNTNYIAVGAVLEKVTGKSLAALVRERIARPLGLRHTFYATGPAWRGRHAHGYEPDAAHMPPNVPEEFRTYAGPRHDDHVDVTGDYVTAGGADAAIVSTAGDWSRFYGALMSGRLLPAAQLAEMRATVPEGGPDDPEELGYGLGIERAKTACGTVWDHVGVVPGYATYNVTDSTGHRTAAFFFATSTLTKAAHRTGAALMEAINCAILD